MEINKDKRRRENGEKISKKPFLALLIMSIIFAVPISLIYVERISTSGFSWLPPLAPGYYSPYKTDFNLYDNNNLGRKYEHQRFGMFGGNIFTYDGKLYIFSWVFGDCDLKKLIETKGKCRNSESSPIALGVINDVDVGDSYKNAIRNALVSEDNEVWELIDLNKYQEVSILPEGRLGMIGEGYYSKVRDIMHIYSFDGSINNFVLDLSQFKPWFVQIEDVFVYNGAIYVISSKSSDKNSIIHRDQIIKIIPGVTNDKGEVISITHSPYCSIKYLTADSQGLIQVETKNHRISQLDTLCFSYYLNE